MRAALTFLALVFLAPFASGQFSLSQMVGSTEQPLSALLDFGSIASGAEKSIRVRIRNTSGSRATIHTLQVRGSGFSMPGGLAPLDLATGGVQDVLITFSASTPADYSATLQVNSASVFLIGRVTPSAVLTVFPVCTADGSRTIDFGTVTRGETRVCNFQLQNPSNDPIPVQTLTVTGGAFTGSGIATPFTLAPGESRTFTIRFAPITTGVALGALTVQSIAYDLKGNAIEAPVPRPIFDFGPAPFASAQQRTLTLHLPSPAPDAASGVLQLTFLPDAVNAPGDAAVAFLPTLSRQLTFTIAQGSTEVRLDGAPSVIFQTGTTAGRIRFTMSGPVRGFTSDPTTVITIPPTAIVLQSAMTSRKAAVLELRVVAFDNTYTAGSVAFRFFDTRGNPMGDAIPADFIAAFRNYFSSLSGGSAFAATFQFPVTGDISQIGAIEADLANSAGTTRTQRISF